MAIKRFFERFPVIDYDGKPAINLMKRVDIASTVKEYYSRFYTYTIDKDDRIEHLAYNYYDDVNLDWLIYLVNDINDPYYGVVLSELDFQDFIVKKYGSLDNALQTIVHWKNNWESDDTILSSEQYNNLIADRKKYWGPIYNSFGTSGYVRQKEDIIVTTNKYVSLNLATTANAAASVGDILIKDSNSSVYGTVAWANTSAITVQHVYGDWTAGSDYTVTKRGASDTYTVDADSVSVRQVINTNEEVYFSAVTSYDFEDDLNERNREVFIVDSDNASSLNKQLNDMMNA